MNFFGVGVCSLHMRISVLVFRLDFFFLLSCLCGTALWGVGVHRCEFMWLA